MTTVRSAALLCVVLAAAGPTLAQDDITPETITDEHVTKAIDALVDELYARKHPRRFWDPEEWTGGHGPESQVGGYTALTVLAMLYAGQSYQDPRLRDAVDSLSEVNLEGTYALSCRAQVWAQLPAKFRPELETDVQWIMSGLDERDRGWAYEIPPRRPWSDNSLRQYGVLGMWEAAKRGIDINSRFWRLVEGSFVDSQLPDGGWNYRNNEEPARGSMTAAGLTVLMITQDFLHGEDSLNIGRGRRGQADEAIARGMAWMDTHFSATEHPGRAADYFYYMYGVERVGLASGYKFFGGHDWFREGAAELVKRLCTWDPKTREMRADQRSRIRSMAFGLMFLSRGRVPVAVNKLALPDHPWNNRPRDAAKLTDWISTHGESPVNWQIVSMTEPAEAWLDAPLLYLASHEPLPWNDRVDDAADRLRRQSTLFRRRLAQGEAPADEAAPAPPSIPELERLRRYLDLGGTLLVVNEGTARAFAASMQRSAELLYPHYEWRALPEDHFVYSTPQPITKRRLPLKAFSNGVRELIILADRADLAKSLQTRRKPEPAHYEVASNIYYYASELGRPRPRLARHVLSSADIPFGGQGRPASIVRAVRDANWNPEPEALPMLARHLASSVGVTATVTDEPLVKIHELEPRPHLVVANGIEAATFDDAQRAAIEAYVRSGGVILFETPGGRGEFTASAETMAAELFGGAPQSLGRTRIITGRDLPGAVSVQRIEYRPYALHVFGSRENAPRLRGLMIDGEPRVLFSREDISHALLDQPCWGVSGYASSSARDLMTNIVLHAAPPPED